MKTSSLWATLVAAAIASIVAAAPVVASAQTVRISTSLGDITVQLDAAKAPKTVANFVQYAQDGHFDGLIFHRVISEFMIQGGGMNADMVEKATRAPIELESANGLSNERGTIAMARTGVPNSATAQFFINTVNNPMLDKANSRDGHGYAVFGKVTAGMAVVDKIRAVPVTGKAGHQNVPVSPVVIKKVSLVKTS
jgi:peptidyl-prolyl cis-trans isomerase A (cyclophilin A)